MFITFCKTRGKKKKELLHSLVLALTNELLQATTLLYGLMYNLYGSA